MNKQKAEYVDKLIGENIIELTSYNGHELNRYYFDQKEEKLYLYTRKKYKLIKPFFNGLINLVSLIDVEGKPHACSYNKLIRELKHWNEEHNDGPSDLSACAKEHNEEHEN